MPEQFDPTTLKVTATAEFAVLARMKTTGLVLALVALCSQKTGLPLETVFGIVARELQTREAGSETTHAPEPEQPALLSYSEATGIWSNGSLSIADEAFGRVVRAMVDEQREAEAGEFPADWWTPAREARAWAYFTLVCTNPEHWTAELRQEAPARRAAVHWPVRTLRPRRPARPDVA